MLALVSMSVFSLFRDDRIRFTVRMDRVEQTRQEKP